LTAQSADDTIKTLAIRQIVDDAPLWGHNRRADDESREAITSRTLPGDSSSAFLFGGKVKLKIDLLRDDGGTQPRAKIDESVVAEYAEAMRGGAQFPPVVAFYDGSEYWLADGFHRGTAAALAGLEEIEVEVKTGTQEDAIDYAMSAIPNSKHGLRESPEDRHRRVETMIRRKGAWSNRQIAEWCGVSEGSVRNVKGTCVNYAPERVKGRDGKEYPSSKPVSATRPVVDEMPLEEVEQRPKPEPKPEKIEPTPADRAIGDIRNYIDVVLEEVDTDMGRHYVVNSIIKYLREKSIAFNQSA
jgi:hypothetical protein